MPTTPLRLVREACIREGMNPDYRFHMHYWNKNFVDVCDLVATQIILYIYDTGNVHRGGAHNIIRVGDFPLADRSLLSLQVPSYPIPPRRLS